MGKELGFAGASEEIKREEGVTRSAWWMQGKRRSRSPRDRVRKTIERNQ
jgi:hypothetical protein